jgi:hypothetical protein
LKELDLKVREIIAQREYQEYKHLEIFNKIQILLETCNKLDTNFSNILMPENIGSHTNSNNTISINTLETQSNDITNILSNLNIGNLIPLSCGHNGNYNETEIHFIKYELIKGKFI